MSYVSTSQHSSSFDTLRVKKRELCSNGLGFDNCTSILV